MFYQKSLLSPKCRSLPLGAPNGLALLEAGAGAPKGAAVAGGAAPKPLAPKAGAPKGLAATAVVGAGAGAEVGPPNISNRRSLGLDAFVEAVSSGDGVKGKERMK